MDNRIVLMLKKTILISVEKRFSSHNFTYHILTVSILRCWASGRSCRGNRRATCRSVPWRRGWAQWCWHSRSPWPARLCFTIHLHYTRRKDSLWAERLCCSWGTFASWLCATTPTSIKSHNHDCRHHAPSWRGRHWQRQGNARRRQPRSPRQRCEPRFACFIAVFTMRPGGGQNDKRGRATHALPLLWY